MLGRLFRSNRANEAIAAEIYGAIVALARAPALYAAFGVPDTVAGRFEMVVLHMAVAMERFAAGTRAEKALGQSVFERFCADMDESLREFGVGDAVMGRRMKKMAQGFYGRSTAYAEAIRGDDARALAAAISRNAFPHGGGAVDPRLGERIVALSRRFAAVPPGELGSADVIVALAAGEEAPT